MGTGAGVISLGGWIRTIAVGRKPAWTAVRIAVLVVSSFVLFRYVILLRKIESTSMMPTFREGSIHLINRWAYRRSGVPARGDIVAVRTSGETVMYIKRVIGLPGETLAIRNNQVLIDGRPLEESYVRLRRPPGAEPWNRPPLVLGPNQIYVIGDNRSMPQELHDFGATEIRRVVGKVVW